MSANIMTASHAFLVGARTPDGQNNGTPNSGPIASLMQLFGDAKAASVSNRDLAKLAELDERLLADIGIATDEVPLVRASKPFTPRAWVKAR